MNLSEQLRAQEKDVRAGVPFTALIPQGLVTITAVLERTAVYEVTGERRELIRLELVEPVGDVVWFPPRGADRSRRRGQEISHRGQAPPGNKRRFART